MRKMKKKMMDPMVKINKLEFEAKMNL